MNEWYNRLTDNKRKYLYSKLAPQSNSLRSIAYLLGIIGVYFLIFMYTEFSLKLLFGILITLVPAIIIGIKIEKPLREEREALEFLKKLEKGYCNGSIEIIKKQ